MPSPIRDRCARAHVNLMYAVENVLGDLGTVGKAKGEEIMGVIGDELDEIAELEDEDA